MSDESRWPAYVARTVPLGVRGSLSVPLGSRTVSSARSTFTPLLRGPSTRTPSTLAIELAQYAGVVATTADQYNRATTLAEQMQRAMESRAVIEQAKGI